MVSQKLSQLVDCYGEVEDIQAKIPDEYAKLYALCDFWRVFHKTPQFKATFPGDFEVFGRSMGLDWVFDHTKCPPQFRPFWDLLVSQENDCGLTIVPEGVFSFDPDVDKEDTDPLWFSSWDGELGYFKTVLEEMREKGKIPGLRERQLIALLEWEIEKDDPDD